MRALSLILIAAICAYCNTKDEQQDLSGICVHSTTKTTRTGSCGGATASTTVYTYCTDEKKEADCKNLSSACSGAAFASYDDTIIFYQAKKCDTSGYIVTCPGNSSYKVSDTSFCPQ
jgi:hypothetical protein